MILIKKTRPPKDSGDSIKITTMVTNSLGTKKCLSRELMFTLSRFDNDRRYPVSFLTFLVFTFSYIRSFSSVTNGVIRNLDQLLVVCIIEIRCRRKLEIGPYFVEISRG